MPFYVDGNKSGIQNFYDLVAESNPKAIHLPGLVTLSAPVTNPETGLTRVEIVPIAGAGYTPIEDHVEYFRLAPVPAAGTLNEGEISLSQDDYSQEHLKQVIALSLRIVLGDVLITGYGEDDAIIYPKWSGDNPDDAGYVVTAKVTSLIYEEKDDPPFSGTFVSAITDEPLELAMPAESMNGFTAPSQ